VDNGILVDEFGETSVPDVFAAGDVANRHHPLLGRRVRVEHFDNALKQGTSVARAMLGGREASDDVHWFWSDQYDHNVQYVGTRWPGTRSCCEGASRSVASSPST